MKKIYWYLYGAKFVLNKKLKKKTTYKNHFLNTSDGNEKMKELILSDKPFMAARVGFNEMSMMKAFDFKKADKYEVVTKNMVDMAGFFPNDISFGDRFLDSMLDALPETDLLALMGSPYEDYYANHYLKKAANVTPFSVMDFWMYDDSWTKALAGKKVLVIHPFEKAINQQYEKRSEIFGDLGLLPDFELITYKAVNTSGGNVDDRFNDWFEALETMKSDVSRLDFDIALVGCGAYGFPLAAYIKRMGKQVIHMGGVSQILFGIKGQRWTKEGSKVATLINDSWIWPLDEETVVDPERIEGGPYYRPTQSYINRIKESEKDKKKLY